MHFNPFTVLIYLVIAAIAGAIGRAIAGRSSGGCLVSITLGFIGALIGSWLSEKLGLPEPLLFDIGGAPFPFFWSVIGATLFVAVVVLLSGRRLP